MNHRASNFLQLPTVPRFATWDGIGEIHLQEGPEGPDMDLAGATITMHWKTDYNSSPALELSLGNGIENPDPGKLTIPPRVMDIDPENYLFDMRIQLSDGRVIYPIQGRQCIAPSVTHPST